MAIPRTDEEHFSDFTAQIEPHFEQLGKRPLETVADVQQWLDDWSELDAGIAEANTERYVAMT